MMMFHRLCRLLIQAKNQCTLVCTEVDRMKSEKLQSDLALEHKVLITIHSLSKFFFKS